MGWTAPKTWTAGDVLTDNLLNDELRDNLIALKTPPFQQDKSTTTVDITSTSFVDIDNDFNVSITPSISSGTCTLIVMANFVVRPSSTATVYSVFIDLMVDGVSVSGGVGIASGRGSSDSAIPFGIVYPVSGVTPNAKVVKLRAKVESGATARFRFGTTQSHFSVIER